MKGEPKPTTGYCERCESIQEVIYNFHDEHPTVPPTVTCAECHTVLTDWNLQGNKHSYE